MPPTVKISIISINKIRFGERWVDCSLVLLCLGNLKFRLVRVWSVLIPDIVTCASRFLFFFLLVLCFCFASKLSIFIDARCTLRAIHMVVVFGTMALRVIYHVIHDHSFRWLVVEYSLPYLRDLWREMGEWKKSLFMV